MYNILTVESLIFKALFNILALDVSTQSRGSSGGVVI